jgi:hypothetical protein
MTFRNNYVSQPLLKEYLTIVFGSKSIAKGQFLFLNFNFL